MSEQHPTPTPWGTGSGVSNRFIYKHLAPGESENEVVARCAVAEDAARIVSCVNALSGLNVEAVRRLVEWAENAVAKNEAHRPWALDSIVSALRAGRGEERKS